MLTNAGITVMGSKFSGDNPFAPTGGFCYPASVVGGKGEEAFDRKMKLILDVYDGYGRGGYKNHGF